MKVVSLRNQSAVHCAERKFGSGHDFYEWLTVQIPFVRIGIMNDPSLGIVNSALLHPYTVRTLQLEESVPSSWPCTSNE